MRAGCEHNPPTQRSLWYTDTHGQMRARYDDVDHSLERFAAWSMMKIEVRRGQRWAEYSPVVVCLVIGTCGENWDAGELGPR